LNAEIASTYAYSSLDRFSDPDNAFECQSVYNPYMGCLDIATSESFTRGKVGEICAGRRSGDGIINMFDTTLILYINCGVADYSNYSMSSPTVTSLAPNAEQRCEALKQGRLPDPFVCDDKDDLTGLSLTTKNIFTSESVLKTSTRCSLDSGSWYTIDILQPSASVELYFDKDISTDLKVDKERALLCEDMGNVSAFAIENSQGAGTIVNSGLPRITRTESGGSALTMTQIPLRNTLDSLTSYRVHIWTPKEELCIQPGSEFGFRNGGYALTNPICMSPYEIKQCTEDKLKSLYVPEDRYNFLDFSVIRYMYYNKNYRLACEEGDKEYDESLYLDYDESLCRKTCGCAGVMFDMNCDAVFDVMDMRNLASLVHSENIQQTIDKFQNRRRLEDVPPVATFTFDTSRSTSKQQQTRISSICALSKQHTGIIPYALGQSTDMTFVLDGNVSRIELVRKNEMSIRYTNILRDKVLVQLQPLHPWSTIKCGSLIDIHSTTKTKISMLESTIQYHQNIMKLDDKLVALIIKNNTIGLSWGNGDHKLNSLVITLSKDASFEYECSVKALHTNIKVRCDGHHIVMTSKGSNLYFDVPLLVKVILKGNQKLETKIQEVHAYDSSHPPMPLSRFIIVT
jgi:hypothetical protein